MEEPMNTPRLPRTDSIQELANFWDQHDVTVYSDPRWGVPVFQLNYDSSYTSGPVEPFSHSITNLSATIQEGTDSLHVGDTVSATLLLVNNSSRNVHSGLVDSVDFLMGGTGNFANIYTLVSMQPTQFQLARGDSQFVKVRYLPRDTTSIPAGFYAEYGYTRNGNTDYVDTMDVQSARGVRPVSAVDAIQIRPTHLAASHVVAADIARSFGSLAQGSGAAQIGTGIDAADAQTVSVLLPSAAAVRVDIFDNLGTPVISWSRDVSAYDLANLDATGDGRWVLPVSWNGRASNGQAVSAGVYLWKIVVRTEDGQKLETVKKLGLR